MTDEKLDALEAACNAEVDNDGKVRLRSGDVLELVNELRELRNHAVALSALEGAVGTMHRLLTNLCAYGERQPGVGIKVSSHIPVQDPGR